MFGISQTRSKHSKHVSKRSGIHSGTSISESYASDVTNTISNLCAIVMQPKYLDGIDQESLVSTLEDLTSYVLGDTNKRISLPAPANNPDDKFNMMWPEGAVIRSATPSVSSVTSQSRAKRNGPGSDYASSEWRSRASSVSSVMHVPIAEDEEYDRYYAQHRAVTHRPSTRTTVSNSRKPSLDESSSQPIKALKVSGVNVRPTPSMEKIMAMRYQETQAGDSGDDEPEPVKPRRKAKLSAMFADEE